MTEEDPGMPNWVLEGTIRWCSERLKALPDIIRTVGKLMHIGTSPRNGIYGRECSIRVQELFKMYQDWCEKSTEHASSERFFGLRLKELGLEQKRSADGRYWQGLGIKADGV
jgi:putative DNA primase/helicase